MFVVFAAVKLYRVLNGDLRWSFAWYLLALPLCWLLGAAVEHWLSAPGERWLRASLLPSWLTQTARANPLTMRIETHV